MPEKNPELQLNQTGLGPAIDRHLGKLVERSLSDERLQPIIDAAIHRHVNMVVIETFSNVGWSDDRDTVRQHVAKMVVNRMARGDLEARIDEQFERRWASWARDRSNDLEQMISSIIDSSVWEAKSRALQTQIKAEIEKRVKEALAGKTVEWVDVALADFIKDMEKR